MVFLSSYSAISKLSYLIGDSVLLAIAAWKVRAPPGLAASRASCVRPCARARREHRRTAKLESRKPCCIDWELAEPLCGCIACGGVLQDAIWRA